MIRANSSLLPLAAALASALTGNHCGNSGAYSPDAREAVTPGDAATPGDGGDADARPDGTMPCDDATEIYLPPSGTTIVGSYHVGEHWAVYTDWRTSGMEYREDAYAFSLRSCVEVSVAVFPDTQGFTLVDQDEIVYMDAQTNGRGDIYSYDLTTGIRTQLMDTPDDEEWPQAAHYPYLVYETRVPRGVFPDKGLALWNRETDERILLADHTQATEGVSISDRYVSWAAHGDWGKDIYYYDLQSGHTTHVEASGPGHQYATSTYGDYLAYMTEDASSHYHVDVYRYSTGEVERIGGDDGWDHLWPAVWENLVFYKDYSYARTRYGSNFSDTSITDLETGVTRRVTPISGSTLPVGFHSGWALFALNSGLGDPYKNYLYVWNLYRMGLLTLENHVIPE